MPEDPILRDQNAETLRLLLQQGATPVFPLSTDKYGEISVRIFTEIKDEPGVFVAFVGVARGASITEETQAWLQRAQAEQVRLIGRIDTNSDTIELLTMAKPKAQE